MLAYINSVHSLQGERQVLYKTLKWFLSPAVMLLLACQTDSCIGMRFSYWNWRSYCLNLPIISLYHCRKTNYDVLEIIEESLDTNLCNNQVRYKFQDAPILDGITVHERGGVVIMLVPTVSSLHRLTFLHPSVDVSNTLAFEIDEFVFFLTYLLFAFVIETDRVPVGFHIVGCV